MLPDAEIELSGITHQGGVKQQRGVAVGLTIGGREAPLGMLSRGQRNALLLTPLVILDKTGPFGFLVVDDPVHALDDMRVDLLAQELARLGRQRQVTVLTHDPRLEEHLRARVPGMTGRGAPPRSTDPDGDLDDSHHTLVGAFGRCPRIVHVIGLAGSAGRLPCLEHGRDKHLTFWNQGSHGQLPPGVDLEATIDAAARACTELAPHDWSVP
jgi:hypothetical protein